MRTYTSTRLIRQPCRGNVYRCYVALTMFGWFGQGHLDETAYAPASIPRCIRLSAGRRTSSNASGVYSAPIRTPAAKLVGRAAYDIKFASAKRLHGQNKVAEALRAEGWCQVSVHCWAQRARSAACLSHATLARGTRRHFNVKARGKTGWQNLAIYQINTVKEMSAHCRADPEFGGAIQLYANESASGKRPIRSLAEGTSV